MKPKLMLWPLLLIIMSVFVVAATVTLNYPSDWAVTTDTAINFSWTPKTSDLGDSESYLFIDLQGLGYDNYTLNRTVTCTNNTVCNATISGLSTNLYKWYVQSMTDSTNATLTSTNSETFDFITAEVVATINGSERETWNFSTNNTLVITYSVSGSKEVCTVTFAGEAATTTNAIQNITAAGCNVTAANLTGNLSISTTTGGVDEYINVSGNATNILGFTSIKYNGSQTNNNSLGITYTINGVEEHCVPTLYLSDATNLGNITGNITDACNISATASGTQLLLTTKGHGADEYINVSGSAANIIGLSATRVYGTQSNISSTPRWVEVTANTYNRSHIVLANNTYIEGNLNVSGNIQAATLNWSVISGYPAACPAGSYLSQLNDSVTCTGTGITTQINTTNCNITVTGGLITGISGCV